MESQSIISLYTTLQGWRLYGVIWDVLTGSGLALLPLIGFIIDAIQQGRSRGSAMKNDADAAISYIEVGLFRILFVVAIAFVPTGVTALDATVLDVDGATATANDTEYVNTFGADPDIVGTSVNIPVWWWLTMSVSNGITAAVVDEVGTDNALRDLEASLRNGRIEDPQTRYLAQVFRTECWREARHQYFDDPPAGAGEPNIDFIGSQYFYDNYYASIRTTAVLPGYAYTAESMPEFESDPGTGGRPTCTVLWDALQAGIYTEAENQGAVGFWRGLFGGDPSPDEQRDIVERFLNNTPMNELYAADQVNDIRTQEQGFFGAAADWFTGTGTNGVLIFASTLAGMATDAIVIGASTVQSYILMFIYMGLPVAILVSGYSLGFLISGAMVIFSVTFWSALFAIIAHADAFLAQSLWGAVSTNAFENVTNPRELTKKLVHNFVVLGLYLIVPTVSSWLLVAAGNRAGMALGGIAGSASGATGQMTGSLGTAGTMVARGAGRGAVSGTASAGQSAIGVVRGK